MMTIVRKTGNSRVKG